MTRTFYRETNIEVSIQFGVSVKRIQVIRSHGIEPVEYFRCLRRQDGRCAICSTSIDGIDELGHSLARIDHDHKTSEFRGLLCDRCNLLLGKAEDEIGILARAIVYLQDRN